MSATQTEAAAAQDRAGRKVAMPTRARGAEAFRPRSIAAYDLPGREVLSLNKADWPLRADDAVLLIHDAQNHWAQMFEEPRPWIDRIVQLRQACDRAGVPVVYTAARKPRSAAERGLALSLWGLGVASNGGSQQAAQLVEALTPRASDFIIDKPKYSAFFDTDLEALLHRLGRRQILLSGVFAHHGILLTAADAYMRNLQVLLVADAVADYSLAEHMMTLRYVAEVCGCLTTTSNVVAGLPARA
jgi:bifunctional isochorismate lyase / aryl carrier protein